MLVHHEKRDDLKGGGFYMWAHEQKQGTPEGYFTPCAHPSYKGHALIAESIYDYINNNYTNLNISTQLI